MMSLINKDQILFFETDEEFEEFVVAPYATKDFRGQYSEAYKEWVKQGKYFVVMDGSFDSKVNRRRVVIKRVLLPPELHSRREYCSVVLPVRNIGRISVIMFYQIIFDGQSLNSNPVKCREAAALIVQKYTELYGSDTELQALASSIERQNKELLETLIDKACKQEAFKEKLEIKTFVLFRELGI